MRLRTLFGLVTLICGSATAESVPSDIPAEMASWLKSYATSRRTFDGKTPDYFPDATRMAEGQLGTETAAALLFTLEGVRGGTDHLQYLSVFWKRGGHYVFCCSHRVGGKGIGDVETVAISGDTVRLSGKQYVPGTDAMCCPSRPYATDMAVVGSKLVDKRASNNRWRGP
jgi:hypothetical protein